MDFDRLREKPRPRRQLIPGFRSALVATLAWAALIPLAALASASATTLLVATFNIKEGLEKAGGAADMKA
jgi:hypothetical protein